MLALFWRTINNAYFLTYAYIFLEKAHVRKSAPSGRRLLSILLLTSILITNSILYITKTIKLLIVKISITIGNTPIKELYIKENNPHRSVDIFFYFNVGILRAIEPGSWILYQLRILFNIVII